VEGEEKGCRCEVPFWLTEINKTPGSRKTQHTQKSDGKKRKSDRSGQSKEKVLEKEKSS